MIMASKESNDHRARVVVRQRVAVQHSEQLVVVPRQTAVGTRAWLHWHVRGDDCALASLHTQGELARHKRQLGRAKRTVVRQPAAVAPCEACDPVDGAWAHVVRVARGEHGECLIGRCAAVQRADGKRVEQQQAHTRWEIGCAVERTVVWPRAGERRQLRDELLARQARQLVVADQPVQRQLALALVLVLGCVCVFVTVLQCATHGSESRGRALTRLRVNRIAEQQ